MQTPAAFLPKKKTAPGFGNNRARGDIAISALAAEKGLFFRHSLNKVGKGPQAVGYIVRVVNDIGTAAA